MNIDLLRSAKELLRVRETAGKEQRNKKIIVKIKLGTIKHTIFSFFFSFETKAYYIAQAELEFIILLPQLSKCWITAMKWHLANTYILNVHYNQCDQQPRKDTVLSSYKAPLCFS